MSKERLVKYLKGLSKVFETLSKEVNEKGIDKNSLELMKKIGSDLLFKGVTIDLTGKLFAKNTNSEEVEK